MPGRLDETQRAAMRNAARALAAQDGRGIPRTVVVDLAAPGSVVAMHADDGHVLAVVQAAPGTASCFACVPVPPSRPPGTVRARSPWPIAAR